MIFKKVKKLLTFTIALGNVLTKTNTINLSTEITIL